MKKIDWLTLGPQIKEVWRLSLPAILTQITTIVMQYIDSAMVGSLGAGASAAIGLVSTTTWLFSGITYAISAGFSVQVAHHIGAGDGTQARQVVRHGLLTAVCASLLLCLTGALISGHLPHWLGGEADICPNASAYFLIFSLMLPFSQLNSLNSSFLQCSGDMLTPSILNAAMCALDVVFNALLIPHFGVAGASAGTALAFAVVSLIMVWRCYFVNPLLHLRRDEKFTPNAPIFKKALKIGLPVAVQELAMSGAQVASTAIIAPLGTVAIAANSFAVTAESLCYMPGYGIGDAATTLVGQTHGAGRVGLCKNFAYMTVGLGMAVMAVMGVVMYVFAPEMIGVLSPVESIREMGTICLRIEAFAEPFFAASIVTYCVCVGAGDTRKPAMINLGTMWLVRLTLAYALSKSYGLEGVWIAMATELTFRGILFLIRLFRGAWMKSFHVG